ncbi:uncharacterized protein LTHEOB_12925 [Lasiodiplodia theobromae]|uniref:uncharacterized protein n=1 Tax=Lasiodiplodia theobromae TaxID=45133 RepID=UPI0015C339E1|nr:uncharacterized protein LTHEOB_12925 [Lasiodiplodia theobromae]KAF4534630.1 hypothetical protein LTHEOB_12925 [Lasiodiplodia theobromae]
MPFFAKVFKPRDAKKGKLDDSNGQLLPPPKPRWEESWARKEVAPDEVEELIHVCTQELKSRALDTPFLLLPFRPGSDASSSRSFIRSFFRDAYEGGNEYRGEALRAELRLTEPMVLCSIMKWCWSRLPGGVVTWDAYELFRVGEQDSGMAKHAFDTFIPISVDSEARKQIITDFFDLLAAISARGKTNGLGGRKLSRMAGWWAFEHPDNGKGFDDGYKSWKSAADATSHLFFAYLRSLAPEDRNFSGINTLPRSLQALVNQTEYPPEPPVLMQTTTTKVVMIVDSVSPTPFALLRRAKHFEYRDDDRLLQRFSQYEDPVQALTDECRRVLNAISSANQSSTATEGSSDPSWSRFEDLGFGFLDTSLSSPTSTSSGPTPSSTANGLRTTPRARADTMGRPTTPSWADFLSTGFQDGQAQTSSPPMLLPPDKVLPPIGEVARVQSSQSHLRTSEDGLEPGELASIQTFDLDDTFWWVWMTSLAIEEPNERKAVFGRCALLETNISGGKWLVLEEQVKGASEPAEGAYIVEKKSKFSFTKRGRLGRRKSTGKKLPIKEPYDRAQTDTPTSKTSIGPDQHARIQAAAARLAQQQKQQDASPRRGRSEETTAKTNSVMTLQPMVVSEAGPAMKWARAFDKETIRAQYLGDPSAGKGLSRENLALSPSPTFSNGGPTSPGVASTKNDLPPLPKESGSPKSVSRKPLAPSPLPPTPKDETANEAAAAAAQVPLPPPKLDTSDNNVHPAFRSDKKKAVSPSPVAERRKMFEEKQASVTVGSEIKKDEHKKLKKPAQTGGGGGFKKLFGKKKAATEPIQPEKTEPVPTASGGLQVPQQQGNGLVRTLSGLGRKKPAPAEPTPEASAEKAEPSAAPGMRNEAVMYTEDRPPLSRVHTNEREEAEAQFSRFDQGPLDDQPAFAPEDAEDEALTPHATHFQDAPEVPETPGGDDVSQADVSSISSASIDLAQQVSPTQDRWAQIRKNAAERAARMSEDQSYSRPRFSESQTSRTTMDDGDTSGEETIESRVARIKARVAELTGNMDSSGNIVTGAHR